MCSQQDTCHELDERVPNHDAALPIMGHPTRRGQSMDTLFNMQTAGGSKGRKGKAESGQAQRDCSQFSSMQVAMQLDVAVSGGGDIQIHHVKNWNGDASHRVGSVLTWTAVRATSALAILTRANGRFCLVV